MNNITQTIDRYLITVFFMVWGFAWVTPTMMFLIKYFQS